jgi:hypothetical protein
MELLILRVAERKRYADMRLGEIVSRQMLMRNSIFAAVLLFFSAPTIWAGDFRVEAGRRIGAATLGMTTHQVRRALGVPHRTVRLDDGVVREDWLSKSRERKFVTIYFREAHAIQIEVNSEAFKTRDNLSTASGAVKFQQRYADYKKTNSAVLEFVNPGGSPAPKHIVMYEDDVKLGIAWRYGAWGSLAPDPDPGRLEIVIVHTPGKPVIVDPDGGIRFAGK